ncbi:hypothetical protein VINE108521_00590 [Vibrio neonatus]
MVLGTVIGGTFVSHNAQKESEGKQATLQQLSDQQVALNAENNEIKAKLQTFKEDGDSFKQEQTLLKQAVTKSEKANAQLKQQKKQLDAEVANLKKQLKQQQDNEQQLQDNNQELQTSLDKKNAILAQSKEYFQDQLKLQQEVHELHVQREKLIVTFNDLAKECQVFTEGKSWDAKSDSCERKQKASDRLKAIDKSINVKQAQLDSADSAVK